MIQVLYKRVYFCPTRGNKMDNSNNKLRFCFGYDNFVAAVIVHQKLF